MMKEAVLILYEFLTVMIPAGICLIILYREKNRNIQIVMMIIFAVYLFAVFYITGAGTIYNVIRNGLEINEKQINLIPFSEYGLNRSVYITQALLNILLFVPVGVLVPLIWQNYRKIWSILLSGFLLSFVIEFSQLLNHRSFDIDDLIYNTAGTVCGALLFKLIFRSERWSRLKGRSRNVEMILLTIAAFLFRFLLFDEMGAAKLLYGF